MKKQRFKKDPIREKKEPKFKHVIISKLDGKYFEVVTNHNPEKKRQELRNRYGERIIFK